MPTPRMTLRRAAVVGACVLSIGVVATACGGDDDAADATTDAPATTAAAPATTEAAPATTGAAPPATTQAAAEPEPGLPPYTAGYQDWLRLNAEPIPPIFFTAPADTKNVYVSPTRAEITQGGEQQYPYPDGTVVLKAGSRGGDDAAIIAVMHKVAGVDPAHGDWEYIEWSRGSADSEYTVLARDEVCWTCHAGAEQTDWVFTTLE